MLCFCVADGSGAAGVGVGVELVVQCVAAVETTRRVSLEKGREERKKKGRRRLGRGRERGKIGVAGRNVEEGGRE